MWQKGRIVKSDFPEQIGVILWFKGPPEIRSGISMHGGIMPFNKYLLSNIIDGYRTCICQSDRIELLNEFCENPSIMTIKQLGWSHLMRKGR